MTTEKKTAASKPAAKCNAPGCGRAPAVRGLCNAHWATQRGLADRKG